MDQATADMFGLAPDVQAPVGDACELFLVLREEGIGITRAVAANYPTESDHRCLIDIIEDAAARAITAPDPVVVTFDAIQVGLSRWLRR